MKFNTKTRYGLRAMIELGMSSKNVGVYQKEISERQDISFKYLDQIISSLKASGLILNSSGRMSGYILSRDPENISIYDIFKSFEHELAIVDCLNGDGQCNRERKCAARDFWQDLNELIIEHLESVKLADLARKQRQINDSEVENMFYI
jgi:Rrf2 family protein